MGVQPHSLELLQVQVAFIPQFAAWQLEPPPVHVQVVVQKCVVLSPTIEHNVASWLPRQSSSVVQNFPTPLSLPVSPGWPHADWNASTAASAFAGDLLLLHAAMIATATTMMMMTIRFRMPKSAGTIAHACRRVNGLIRGVRCCNHRCK